MLTWEQSYLCGRGEEKFVANVILLSLCIRRKHQDQPWEVGIVGIPRHLQLLQTFENKEEAMKVVEERARQVLRRVLDLLNDSAAEERKEI